MTAIPAEEARLAILAKVQEYARGRKSDVARGAETPELAGLMVQKYGYGLCDTFTLVYGPHSYGAFGRGPTYNDVDVVVAEIDPDWRDNQSKRWKARPAGLVLNNPEA